MAWLSDIKDEDLKHVKLFLGGVVCSQMVIWSDNHRQGGVVECGININQWLLVISMLMIAEIVIRSKRVYAIDNYFENTSNMYT